MAQETISFPPTISPASSIPYDKPQESVHDFNTTVIVAAILCALLCALGLNSMLHCVIRCAQQALTEPVEWFASRRHNSGLKKEMGALPTSTYSSSNSSTSSGCAICLVDFSEGDKLRVLPRCNHGFHVACIDKWLLSHSSCPNCRDCLKCSHPTVSLNEVVTAL